VRFLRPRLRDPLVRQRVKLICWDIAGYWRLLILRTMPLRHRLPLFVQFVRVDWNVLHAHRPHEIAWLCQALCGRRAKPGEVVVEAGCWQGGSSAKLSLACELLGYELHIYDSFQGVEPVDAITRRGGYDFSFEYSSPQSVLRRNLAEYGRPTVCTIHPGWFADTLAIDGVKSPVRLAYIDCDLAKGTQETLRGVLPSLTSDGWVFSQDFHIDPIRAYLTDPASWDALGVAAPSIQRAGPCLAAMRWRHQAAATAQTKPDHAFR
jgi:O-methyltransferase